MNRVISLTVLVAGVALIIYGLYPLLPWRPEVSKLLTGLNSQRAVALLCSGAVFALLGGYGMSRRSRSY